MVSSQGSPTKIPLPPQESPHSSMDHLRFEAEELLAASDMLPPTSFLYKLHFSNKPSESIDAQLLFNFLKENKLATFRVYLLSFFKKCFSLYAKLGAFETLSLLTENDHQLWQETSFLDEELKSEILGYLKNNTEWSGRFLPKIHEFIVKLVIKEVKSENEWPELTQFLHQSLGNGSEEKVEFSLHLLCKLIPQCTVETWLSTNLHQVVESVFKFLGKAELQEKTRLLALEFVVTLAEGGNKGRKMLLDSPLFIKELIKRILGLLEVIEDDPEWETAQSDDRSQGLTSVSATNTLSRIAAALDGQVLLSTFLQPFFSHLEDVEWKRRLAAVNFLAIIADSCSKLQTSKYDLNRMARLLRGVVKKDIHPRVCWAALNTIKEYCKHLSPRFQEDCHQHVLGALRKAMEDFEYPSVQAQASSAMFYFVKNCDAYILKPYLKKLVGKLIDQIERGKCMVKVEALRALSSIANSSKDQFEEFYSTVMPYLKAMMMTAKADSDSILLAASMECITIIWMVVGKERIGTNDAERVGEVLISLIRPELEENNRMRIQVLQACGRLCKILGQDFRPYNMVAIPCLLKAAKNESYVFVPENPDNMEESDGSIRTLIVEGQKTWIKTEVLEQKVIACSELYRCAAELKEDFYLWIEEVAGILVPLLNFEYNEEIRRVAALAMPVLLKSSEAAVQKRCIASSSETLFNKLCYNIVPALVKSLTKGTGVEILESLDECMKVSGAILEEEDIKFFLVQKMEVLIKSPSISRSKMVDTTDQEPVEEENLKEEKISDKAADCLSTLIGTQKYCLSSLVDKLLPLIQLMWENDKTAKERNIALRVFREVAIRFQGKAFKGLTKSLEDQFSTCMDENPEVNEILAKAIGIFVEFGGSVSESVIRGLISVIGHPKALDKEYVMARDAAVASLGKIFEFNDLLIEKEGKELKESLKQDLTLWLSHLPMRSNRNEAKVVHHQLCLLFERSEKNLLGRNNDNLSEIFRVYAEILLAGKKLATEQTMNQMITQLKRLRNKLLDDHWKSSMSSLEPHLQKKLESVLST